ncbi:MAG: 16S rRNA (uracil(1498)-N(3))-methyltransferase [Patescibacteria group bacterium]|nr:16S rRNA (uracil(1498)-N(3))-methyltransferase [Patescibacteria group bacterium]MDE1988269.1 16S rRNA (uracil(1498)-N(3))-methyltransferase [Patescibacteria group bacterium]MDE2218431.1 16S rRNA (uracil(1498)-N(3))-methyltransferase [Patescibacteria group bacterium]
MRLHRFFMEREISESGEVTIIDNDLIRQWGKVFRFKVGDRVILFDGLGFDYVSDIVLLDKNKGVLKVVEKIKNENVPKKEIHLFQSIIKKDKFEWVLEKGTELGVSYFHPIVSERSEKKNINFERGRKIIKEASEQSGRGRMPILGELTDLEESLNNNFPSIAFHPMGDKFERSNFEKEKVIGIFIGPEGGWGDRELEIFKEREVKILSLGSQIFRAETAAVAVSSLFLL